MSKHSTKKTLNEKIQIYSDYAREQWREVPSRKGYQASDVGRVKSVPRIVTRKRKSGLVYQTLCRGRILKPWVLNGKGYLQVRVGGRVSELVHRLVLEAFVGPCPEGMECRHLNGIKTDNRVENLVWGTPVENAADRILHGTDPSSVRLRNPYQSIGKLTAAKVENIRALYLAGMCTQKELADIYGIHQVTVSEIVTRKIWKHI